MSERRKKQEPIDFPDRRARIDQVEAWWALIARVLSFVLGCVILATQIGEDSDRVYLIIAGIGLCGPVVAQSVATVFAAIRTGER